jgi:hypothetical protein
MAPNVNDQVPGKRSVTNPYAPTKSPGHGAVFLGRGQPTWIGWLSRKLEFDDHCLSWTAWKLFQRIEVDQRTVWFRVSWVRIHSTMKFYLPDGRPGLVEIQFGWAAQVKRFQFWVDHELVFEERNP